MYLVYGLGSGHAQALRHIAVGVCPKLTATTRWGFFE